VNCYFKQENFQNKLSRLLKRSHSMPKLRCKILLSPWLIYQLVDHFWFIIAGAASPLILLDKLMDAQSCLFVLGGV
jgi:hypothetical protein